VSTTCRFTSSARSFTTLLAIFMREPKLSVPSPPTKSGSFVKDSALTTDNTMLSEEIT
jgi:hypothetical protein